jgi:hypothetical protein
MEVSTEVRALIIRLRKEAQYFQKNVKIVNKSHTMVQYIIDKNKLKH